MAPKRQKPNKSRRGKRPDAVASVCTRREKVVSYLTLTQGASTQQQVTYSVTDVLQNASPNLYGQFNDHRVVSVNVSATVESAAAGNVQFRRVYFYGTKNEATAAATMDVRTYDRSGMPLAGRRQMRFTYNAQDEAGEWFTTTPNLFTVIYGGQEGDVVRLHMELDIVHTRPL